MQAAKRQSSWTHQVTAWFQMGWFVPVALIWMAAPIRSNGTDPAVTLTLPTPAPVARKHDPEDPFVRKLVEEGVRYLNRAPKESELGGECLVALAIYKSGDKEHPRIGQALNRVRDSLSQGRFGGRTMYSAAITLIFLCEVDPQGFRGEIQALLQHVIDRQQSGGGWSYSEYKTGDTSQTQYCCLAMWAVQNAGFRVPPQAGARVLNWLMRTQDPAGAWGYQGRDPGNLNQRVEQSQVSLSLSAAGLGSAYIIADWLGYGKDENVRRHEEKELPPSVSLVLEDEEDRPLGEKLVRINENALERCKQDGNRWFDQHFTADSKTWPYYYLYGYERYASFREKAEGFADPEPAWYNAGVEYLAAKQNGQGYWDSRADQASDAICTSFAILFLVRSTKKSIGEVVYNEGVLRGGQGLRDEGTLSMRGGKIVNTAITKNVGDLLALLESQDENQSLDSFADSLTQLSFGDDMSSTQKQAILRNLISHKRYEVRLIAARYVARVRDLDHAPVLIYALSDPNTQVMQIANDGLRFISRKFNGPTISDNPDESERDRVKNHWINWYFSVQPEGSLLQTGDDQ